MPTNNQTDLRSEIQEGIEELDAGKWIDGNEVFSELRERARMLSEEDLRSKADKGRDEERR